uniref:Uncharacterized protein n=1 Tax=Romanomermis culicivorax TaxID=13658 RepID=A0A915L3D8_ROMCU
MAKVACLWLLCASVAFYTAESQTTGGQSDAATTVSDYMSEMDSDQIFQILSSKEIRENVQQLQQSGSRFIVISEKALSRSKGKGKGFAKRRRGRGKGKAKRTRRRNVTLSSVSPGPEDYETDNTEQTTIAIEEKDAAKVKDVGVVKGSDDVVQRNKAKMKLVKLKKRKQRALKYWYLKLDELVVKRHLK